ncbi:MAG: TPM domain-containing protein [Firmicutes bacterium]|nr:TPM domain-containing protein [Bacillota bacterium]
MRKKIFAVILSLVFCLMMAAPAVAAETAGEEHPSRLVDEADLLTDTEESTLVEKLDTVSEKWQCDVAIVTVESLGNKTATEFADDYFDYNGYGLGVNADGVMLVISMESRDWAITTHAFCINAFTDAGQEYIMDKVLTPLGEGNYEEAFNIFTDQCDVFLEKAITDEPYDTHNLPGKSSGILYVLLIIPCLIAGMIIALMMTRKEKRSLKSVMKKAGAREYIGGVKLTNKSDKFLYRNVDRVLIVKDDDDSGSSTHISSSGEFHGGSSGKF